MSAPSTSTSRRKPRPLSTAEGFGLGGIAACVAVRHFTRAGDFYHLLSMCIHQTDIYLLGLVNVGVGDVLEYPGCCKDTYAAPGRAREGRWCEGVQECV